MGRSAEFMAEFGGEDRLFRLPIGRLRAVQEKCDAGPMELLQRFLNGTYRIDDVRETLLQGLVGGGMNTADAARLMKSNFDDLPLTPFIVLAQGVMMAVLVGAEDETLGEPEGEAEQKTPSPVESSASPASTAPPPPSVSIRGKRTT